MADLFRNLPTPIALIIAILSGAMVTFSFAPFDFWPISLLSLVALSLLLKEQASKQILWRSLAFGLGLYAAGIHWIYVSIHNFGGAAPLFAAFLVFIFAAFMAAIFTLPFYIFGRWFSYHRLALLIALPACWLLGEWSRTWLLTGFPWLFLGYSHIDTWLAGWAPIGGVMAISFVLVANAGLVAELLWQGKQLHQQKLLLAAAAIINLGFWISGAFLKQVTWAEPDNNPIKVGMVQPNVDQSIKLTYNEKTTKATLDQLRELSTDLWTNDWVIWPEAAIPTSLTFHDALPFLEEMNKKAAENQAALFTGVIYEDRDKQKYYNSIAGLGEGYGFYHKRRLVPFGEYVPLEDQLRGLIEFFNLPTSFIHLGPQDQHGLIAKGVRITPAICYEIVYPDLIGQAAKETQVLLSVNNLGWFLDSIQAKQFMQMAQMRALETGRYLVYSTNNGPSAIINNKGQILNQSDSFNAQTFTGTIYAVKDWTPFMVTSSGPLVILSAFLLLALQLPLLYRKQPD
ncbi:apolipoprotein N-acyltransferase [Cellvibrio fontiphilus]|uniref:Apolipoprotein N-acyltransferase n=1 Tax=Cellvibrio fontiphilus TaxID=1815559 RepID=A0ABV7FIC1_9GAMM